MRGACPARKRKSNPLSAASAGKTRNTAGLSLVEAAELDPEQESKHRNTDLEILKVAICA